MLRIKVKRNVLLVAAVAFAASCLCGCVDDAVSAVPEVKIEIVEVTPAAVTFTIKSSDALEGAYVVVEDGKDIPSAADVLTEGTAIDVSVPVTETVEGLSPSTKYHVIAAVAGENGQVVFDVAEAETLEDPAPAPVVLERGSGRIYGTSNNVGVTLRGVVDGIDYELSLDLYDDSCRQTGYLGAGTYELSSGSASGSFNSEYSYLQMDNDQHKFTSGTLEVKITDKEYSFVLDVTLKNGERFIATYDGELEDLPIK